MKFINFLILVSFLLSSDTINCSNLNQYYLKNYLINLKGGGGGGSGGGTAGGATIIDGTGSGGDSSGSSGDSSGSTNTD